MTVVETGVCSLYLENMLDAIVFCSLYRLLLWYRHTCAYLDFFLLQCGNLLFYIKYYYRVIFLYKEFLMHISLMAVVSPYGAMF